MTTAVDRGLAVLRRFRLHLFAWRLRLHARMVGGRVRVTIDPSARIRGRVHIFVVRGTWTRLAVGPGSVVERGTLLHLGGGEVRVGPDTQVRAGCVLRVRGGTLVLAGGNVLSYFSTVHCDDRVEVGWGTIVGEHVTIADSNHHRTDHHGDPNSSMLHSITTAPVLVGTRGWIGTKCTVTSGVRIGDDVVLGANAVVVGDLPDGVNAAGVPARVLSRAATAEE